MGSAHRRDVRSPQTIWQKLGSSTATDANVRYRLGRLQQAGILRGTWLDLGCATGGYTRGLARLTGCSVVGVDVEENRLREAAAAGAAPAETVRFVLADGERLPFAGGAFDGVLLNETLEHVDNERATLAEAFRVTKPGGYVAVMSPNRGCPFEGHGAVFGPVSVPFPVPLLPWLPARIASHFMVARNYWPRELRELVRGAGFRVRQQAYVMPLFSKYPMLPEPAIGVYRRLLPTLERTPALRRLGVSTLIIGQKARAA